MKDCPHLDASPFLLVLSGPSGCGKSSLIKGFRAQEAAFVMSISVTTRPPRGAEQDGVDYFFTDQAHFQELIDAEALLEYATVFGRHSYGTPRAFIEDRFALGKSVIMDIDVQGARQIRARMPARSCLVFVGPPSLAVLEARLRGRGTDDDEAIARRLATASEEMAAWSDYDYLIINDRLEEALADLQAIVRARQLAISVGSC